MPPSSLALLAGPPSVTPDTNATVVTLLDMYLAANPDKKKSDAEKDEMDAKYKPGDGGPAQAEHPGEDGRAEATRRRGPWADRGGQGK